jgi:hypothetical protein
LFSIDLAPLDASLEPEFARAVSGPARARWTLIRGSSRRSLPPLLNRVKSIDLFIHDSMHTGRNMSFELQLAWLALEPGGFILVDDIHRNAAFQNAVDAFRSPWSVVCSSEDSLGMFGIIRKPPLTTEPAGNT